MTQIVERIRDASGARTPLRIAAAGTWLDAGAPVDARETLSLSGCGGIVEYVPGDLTLTAGACTTLAEISAATRAHDQWLPLDPWGGDDGTLGATIATATAGPHSFAMGLPRDVVLGVAFVTGAGKVVRAGGRVVKNVAGFDLVRLVTGSWGTLGVILEATVRLRARPQETRTLVIPAKSTAAELSALATRLRALPITPLASELLSATFAARLGGGLPFHPCLLVRVAGNAKSVAAQADRLRELGSATDADDALWDRLRTAERVIENAASWRWSQLPSEFGDAWAAAERATREMDGTLIHGNPARGVVRVVTPATLKPKKLAKVASDFAGTVAVERMPADAWPLLPAMGKSNDVARAVRERFDPAAILNPGIMGGLV